MTSSPARQPEPARTGSEIAIVGMACHFPGARNPDEFWRNLRDGVESVRVFPREELIAAGVSPGLIENPNYVRSGVELEAMEAFDAAFFGIGNREALLMDPQHRHFLECSWEALENAGYDPARFPGSIGVFGGCGMNGYLLFNLLPNQRLMESDAAAEVLSGANEKDDLTAGVASRLGLRGPAITVQTACSTSLAAMHLASQSLLAGECDLALAGGVTIEVPHRQGYLYQEGEILSQDGHCRSFDDASTGTIFGSGAGVVVLRRLDDALADRDTIHAVIRSTAINNDGSRKVSYLAPSVDGQADAISEAIAMAGIDSGSIGYVETHGTGTRVGDPIEMTALTKAFFQTTERRQYCGIGSVKTNIGHLDTAAGAAGVIKTVQALKHRTLPPSLHFRQPNRLIDFENSPFYVNARSQEWESTGPRRALVSSLGVGGTNAHAVIEEAPLVLRLEEPALAQLLPLSARSAGALDRLAGNLGKYLIDEGGRLSDVAYTLQTGRQAFPHRRVVVGSGREGIGLTLGGAARQPNSCTEFSAVASHPVPAVLFSFPNLDAQTAAEFRAALQEWLPTPTGSRLLGAQATVSTQAALAQLWISWGIQPAVLAASGLGALAAAVTAGVLPLEDALRLAALVGDPAALMRHLSELHLSAPSIPLISSTDGRPVPEADLAEPRYWFSQLVHANPPGWPGDSQSTTRCMVEIGPPPAGTSNSARHWMLANLGRLWCAGVEVDWPALHTGKQRFRIPLPTYPFDRSIYWIEPDSAAVLD